MKLLLLLAVQLISIALATKTPKALIIGIDGVRSDVALEQSQMKGSAFGRMQRSGAWTYHASTGPVSISGPCWASHLTGVFCDIHNVTDNSFQGSLINDTLFSLVKKTKPEAKLSSVVNWKKINDQIMRNDADIMEDYQDDFLVKQKAIEWLEEDKELDLLFVHLDDPDYTGHHIGFSSNILAYVRALKQADINTAEIMEALDRRLEKFGEDEDWLVLVVSDHGGGGLVINDHCPSSPEDRLTVLFVMGGATIPGEMLNAPTVADTTPIVLQHMGIDFDPSQLDGRNVAFDPDVPFARQSSCKTQIIECQPDDQGQIQYFRKSEL